MKKLNLKLDNIKEMLTKEQMKKIVGGYGNGSKRYQCCPDLSSPNVSCSPCVEVPAGSTASCTFGTLTAC